MATHSQAISVNAPTQSSLSTQLTAADKLSVQQLNLHRCIAASAEMCRVIQTLHTKTKQTICLLQEPWTVDDLVKGFDDKTTNIFYAKANRRPRACIVASADLNFTFMPHLSDADVATVLLKTGNNFDESLLLSSIYLGHDCTEAIPGESVRATVKYSNDLSIPLIMGGDVNAHHEVWGSNDTNPRGRNLLEFLATTDLEILNRGNSPTFVTSRRAEVLDLTVCSQSIVSKVINWHVSNEVTLSDHRAIVFEIACATSPPKSFRNPRNTDWAKFNNLAAIGLGNVDGCVMICRR